jgi:aldehyde dehydrogenase (NAD+)
LLNLVSCVAAGNSAIIKPSEFTPNAANILKKIITESFAENEVAVVMGDISVSTHLLDKKFDHIHFTGSPAVGKIVMKAAAEHLTSVTLELGGKSPVIIDDSANIDAAVKKLVWGKFVNLGQTCIAPDYILIDEKRKEEFITKFKAQLVKSFGENAQQSKDLARIINAKNHQRLCGILEDAVNKGATIAVGGNADEKDKFIYPTLLTNVSDDMRIMNEEIFGPLLPMKTYSKIEDAIAYINQKEKPLSLYVFSQKSAIQDLVINSTSAGGSCINDNVVHFSQPYLPFGGINNSGIGKSHGVFGFKEFSNSRAVLKALHSGSIAMPLWFPYGSLVRKVVDIMIKYL